MPRFDGHRSSSSRSRRGAARKAGLGATFFLIYALLNTIYFAINALDPQALETDVVAGANLAVVYGFGLSVAALGLAILYARLSRAPAESRRLQKKPA